MKLCHYTHGLCFSVWIQILFQETWRNSPFPVLHQIKPFGIRCSLKLAQNWCWPQSVSPFQLQSLNSHSSSCLLFQSYNTNIHHLIEESPPFIYQPYLSLLFKVLTPQPISKQWSQQFSLLLPTSWVGLWLSQTIPHSPGTSHVFHKQSFVLLQWPCDYQLCYWH